MPRRAGLEKQNVSIPILDGLKENVHRWLVPEGTLTECQNIEIDKQGTAKKRAGYSLDSQNCFSGSWHTTQVKRLGKRNEELYLLGAVHLAAFSENSARWVIKDKSFPCLTGRIDVGMEHLGIAAGVHISTGRYEDCAIEPLTGIMCYVRMDYDAVNVHDCVDVDFIDTTTGQTIYFKRIVNAGQSTLYPKCLYCDGYFIITYMRDDGGGIVDVFGVNVVASAAGIVAAIASWPTERKLDGSATAITPGVYDISLANYGGGGADRVLVAAVDNTATRVIRLREYDPADLTTPTASGNPTVADINEDIEAISCSAVQNSGSGVVFYFINNTATAATLVQAKTISTSGATISVDATQTIDSAVTRDRVAVSCLERGSELWMAYSYVDDGTDGHGVNVATTTYVYCTTPMSTRYSRTMANMALAGPLFEKNSLLYHVATPYHRYSNETPGFPASTEDDDLSYSQFLVELDPASPATLTKRPRVVTLNHLGRAVYRYCVPGGAPNAVFLGAEHSWYNNITYSAQRYLADETRKFEDIEPVAKGFAALKYDFADQTRQGMTQLAGLATVGAGLVAHYDGSQLVENNFPWVPRITALTYNAGAVFTVDHNYVAVYEVYDSLGNRLMSAPSLPVTADCSGTNSASVDIEVVKPTLTGWMDNESQERTEVFITIYRQEVSTAPYYFLLRRRVPYADGFETDILYAGSITLQDAFAIGSRDDEEQLYTTGGELENDPPPAGHILTTYANRIFVVSDEDPSTIYYSKEYVPTRGIQFSLGLYERFDDDAGAITGLGVMDNLLVVFKTRRTYALSGQGPSATGQPPDGFGAAQVISSIIGCSDHRSVVNTVDGVMFRSEKGFMLLDRSLNIVPIGEAIEDQSAAYPTVLNATVVQKKGMVKFLCSDTPGGTAPNATHTFRIFGYDYINKTWVQDITGWEEQSVSHFLTAATEWGGNHYLAGWTNAAIVARQLETTWVDGGQDYIAEVWWAWLKLGNLQDYKRIWRARILGEALGHHGFRVHVQYNYDETSTTTYTWSQATIEAWGLAAGEPEQFEVHIPKQKCQSIRIGGEMYQSKYGGTNSGVRIVALDLEVGLKRPGFKNLPAAQRK